MHAITANELKLKGINALKAGLLEQSEIMISERGKGRFVVMHIDHYHYLRECELEAALFESKSDLAKGKVIVESIDKHMKRITKDVKKLCSN